MAASITIDTRDFSRLAAALVQETKSKTRNVLREVSRRFVQQAAQLTPPFKNWSTATDTNRRGFAGDKPTGDAAVKRDVSAMFTTIENLVRKSAFFSSSENAALRQRVRQYAKAGNYAAVMDIMTKTKHTKSVVVPRATKDLHQSRRGSTGRVLGSAKRNPFMVLDEDSIGEVVDQRKARVGMAKAGWATAYNALGKPFPEWIARHNAPGVFSQKGGGKQWTEVTVGNAVGYIQGTGASLRIIQTALKMVTANMRKQLTATIAANLKKFSRGRGA